MNVENIDLENIKKNLSIEELNRFLKQISNLKVLIIGDIIIDEYVFVKPKGRAIKDPILSTSFIKQEKYAGGILAIANHVQSFVKQVKLVTLIGDQRSEINLIKNSLKSNISLKIFVKSDSPTTNKKRFIDSYRNNNKLFKVEYINDKPISDKLTREIVSYLHKEIPKYDLVIVGDFGHGFINQPIRNVLQKKSKFLSINVQSNSANMGYNYINHYERADFITMNDEELRMPLMMRFQPLEEVLFKFNEKFNYSKFLVTVGKEGSILFNNRKLYKSPVLIKTVVDTVGAGDALFSIASLFIYINADERIIPFLANCAGGIKANYIGNKESVTKQKLLSFVKETLQ